MEKIKITQVKSGIHCMERQKRTLEALGLSMNRPIVKTATPQILGMLKKVSHLVLVEKAGA